MKVRLTEQQIEYIKKSRLNENYVNSSPESIRLADQLFNDPNTYTLWRCYWKKDEESIFKYGMTSDWIGAGEGSYHGDGVYAFTEPFGAQKRVGTGGVGDSIMKGVLRNKLRNFLILDGDIAERYYGNHDIRTQVNALYTDEAFKAEFIRFYYNTLTYNGYSNGYEIPHKRTTGFISKALWDKFHTKLGTGKCRGVVYNGSQDPHACLIYNPKDFIPICVTNERRLNASGRDFDNWEVKITQETLSNINNVGDYHSFGERLRAEGLIKSYTKVPPKFGFLRVTLNNGKTSYYDTENKKLVSKFGFDNTINFSKDSDGTISCPCSVNVNGRVLNFIIVPQDGVYYICYLDKQTNTLTPIPRIETSEKYDRMMEKLGSQVPAENTINESEDTLRVGSKIEDLKRITGLNCYFESIYHRTMEMKSCQSICDYGFSPEFSKTEVYGHGIYAALTPQDSTYYLSGYGRYMIHAYLKDGFKNFVIFNERLARKYYGENWRVRDQLKKLIRPEYYEEIMSRYPNLPNDESIIQTLEGQLGKTMIRGSVVSYGSCYIVVVCDWKSAIPYEYSTDNGETWTKTLNEKNFSHIDNFKDGLFAIQRFINDGIIEDTFGVNSNNYYRHGRNWDNDVNAHPQFVNGYLRVKLKNNGKITFYSAEDDDLISYQGFDTALNWSRDEDDTPYLECMINRHPFFIYKYKGQYVFTHRVRREEEGALIDVNEVVRLKNGTPLTTKIYDKMSNK